MAMHDGWQLLLAFSRPEALLTCLQIKSWAAFGLQMPTW